MLITEFKNKHKGERCFILGNGPSLNQVDLPNLPGFTFGTNRIYLKGFVPDYYCCVNPLVLEQFKNEINLQPTVKFVSVTPASLMFYPSDVVYLDTTLGEPAFSSPEGPIWEGHTVTYVCLQLAYYMGFEEVILLGCDHDYGAIQAAPNQEITGQDYGHFHPDYFKGVKWNAPDLGASEFAYSLAAAAYQRAGRRVVNASARTKLAAFPVVPFNHLVKPGAPKVSAIVSAYKGAQFLEGCLKDLEEQTLHDQLEVVVVCEHESPEYNLAWEWIAKFKWMSIVCNPLCSVYEAWNIGVQRASGEYLTNANSDDRHHPRALELQAQVLDGRLDLDLVYYDSFITWKPNQTYKEFWTENRGRELEVGRVAGAPGVFTWCDYDRAILALGCYIGPQPMWRASLHQKYGLFDPSFQSGGDYEFWLRCAGERNYFHIPRPLGLYFASEGGVELSDPGRAAREARKAQEAHQTPDVDISKADRETLFVRVGDRYVYVGLDDFNDQALAIRLGGDPVVEW